MSGMRNWRLGAAVVVGAVFVGAGGAVAAGKLISPGEHSQAVVSDAAEQLGVEPRFGGFGHGELNRHVAFGGLDAAAAYLGVTEEQLRTEIAGGKSLAEIAKAKGKSVDGLLDALVADANKKIAAAVTAGRLSQAGADRLTASLKEHVTEMVNNTIGPRGGPGRGFGFGHGRGHGDSFGGLDDAASYLGLTEEQLRTELMSGKTLADVAKAKGKPVDGLVDALTADAKKRLDDAVAAGRITKADADKALAEMKQRVTQRVNGVRGPDGLRGFRHGGPDFSGPPPVDPPPIGPPA